MRKADITTGQIEMWASRQLRDYDTHRPGTLFSEGISLGVREAYELQSAVAELRSGRGEVIIGYKVGCTSPKIREDLQINHCVSGRLYNKEKHASGVTLSRSLFSNLAIEGELAVELSREPFVDDDFSGNEIPVCVRRVFPVIELHNKVMRGERATAGELIANNAFHVGFVAGNGIPTPDAHNEPSLSILANELPLDACGGPSLIATISSSLKWLVELLKERKERLSAGQIILTGSITALIPVEEDCFIQVDAPPFGSVEARFVE